MSGVRIDRDQGGKWRIVGVIHDQEDPVLRVVRQLIGTQSIRSADADIADNLARREVDGDHPAIRVGHEQPASGYHDAVGTGGVVVPLEPLERLRPGRLFLPAETNPSSAYYVDASLGIIAVLLTRGVRDAP